jgi:hypothetical protein
MPENGCVGGSLQKQELGIIKIGDTTERPWPDDATTKWRRSKV